MRLSRILRPQLTKEVDETIPVRRILLWVVVWIGLIAGMVLYFKYARLLTPLLG